MVKLTTEPDVPDWDAGLTEVIPVPAEIVAVKVGITVAVTVPVQFAEPIVTESVEPVMVPVQPVIVGLV
jgi:hypothetical protein